MWCLAIRHCRFCYYQRVQRPDAANPGAEEPSREADDMSEAGYQGGREWFWDLVEGIMGRVDT